MHERGVLAEILEKYFSKDEIKDVCFDLGINDEQIRGEITSNYIREFIKYLCRRKKLNDFQDYALKKRPGVDWQEVKWGEVCSTDEDNIDEARSATLILDGRFEDFDKEQFRNVLAAYLKISPEDIRIPKIREGSINVEVVLPISALRKLSNDYVRSLKNIPIKLREIIGADLSRANLSRANLRRAKLREADLSRADLTGANLTEANLTETLLTSANLTKANLYKAFLDRANFTEANLTEADLRGADLRGADLTNADLRGAELRGAYLSGVDLREVDLRGAYLHEVDLTGADLTGAYLRGVSLRGANLTNADLRGAYLTNADLNRAFLDRANFTEANLTGADLTETLLTSANLTGADLSGADLSYAKLDPDFDISTVIYDETTKWPWGKVPEKVAV